MSEPSSSGKVPARTTSPDRTRDSNDGIPGSSQKQAMSRFPAIESASQMMQAYKRLRKTTSDPALDPKAIFESVSKNYEAWQAAMGIPSKLKDGFLPFPNEDDDMDMIQDPELRPILNYSLLEALGKASTEHSENASEGYTANQDALRSGNEIKPSLPEKSLLKDSELEFLREKISNMLTSNDILDNPLRLHKQLGLRDLASFPANSKAFPSAPGSSRGFTLYGTNDEEGLHGGNSNQHIDDGIDEGIDDNSSEGSTGAQEGEWALSEPEAEQTYRYEYGTHHIEVEVNSIPECETHAPEPCECVTFVSGKDHDKDDEEPSCEFTFEYVPSGELVPIHNNVEEKLREMAVLSRSGSGAGKPAVTDANLDNATTSFPGSTKKKNKKKNKKKSKKKNAEPDEIAAGDLQNSSLKNECPAPSASRASAPVTALPAPRKPLPVFGDPNCCLLCEYELIFGSKPRQLIKWYDQRMKWELEKREEIKRKLEHTKLRALRKQRELRQKQLQQQRVLEQIEDSQNMLLIDDAQYEAPQASRASVASGSDPANQGQKNEHTEK